MCKTSLSIAFCLCLAWNAADTVVTAQGDCTPVASIEDMQPVVDAAGDGSTVCVRFDGDGGVAGWNLQGRRPLSIQKDQQVVIDCAGNSFGMSEALGTLTMGRHAKIHYVNCNLQSYHFPDTEHVYGTVHTITNSTFGMDSCRFVLDLNDQYAPTLASLQQNASFDLGELVQSGASAAVHIFSSSFDSLLGPQFRYEITDSTAYCGDAAAVVPSAQQLAVANGPDVITESSLTNNGGNVAPQVPGPVTATSAPDLGDPDLSFATPGPAGATTGGDATIEASAGTMRSPGAVAAAALAAVLVAAAA
eukprot:jgi/Ulvmu1/6014/UM026_0142.1